jgi:N-succinyldiaminopimelate aminotransferase
MTIGEPQHPMPGFVGPILAANIAGFGVYPPNDGTPELLTAITGWISRRYGVTLGHDNLMPLNGTREGLFNACIALCVESKNGQKPAVLMPNPFYQVYAVAALTVGAEPIYVPATAQTGFLPDYAALDAATLNRVAIAYICSPANPQGSVASRQYWRDLLALAEKHDFIILADECYSEIWRTTPPMGALQVAAETNADPERVFTFHSLSKRSNLPGLRSGFVAGGAAGIARMRQLRAFAGAPLPLPIQRVSEAAWNDDAHVVQNQALYHAKFAIADQVFAGMQGYTPPEGGFFLWLPVDDGEAAAIKLWTQTGVRVLPGAYLSRNVGGQNPGYGYIRVAMVAPKDDMQRGLTQLCDCLYK